MDLSNLQSYFNPESSERLGQAAGLNAGEAGRLLGEGLPLQLNALADRAQAPEGQAQIAQALETLPAFPTVDAALDAPDGASTLWQAGQLLAPAVLGDQAGRLAEQINENPVNERADPGKVQHLLDLSLPLLLSYLGQQGLTPANVGSTLPPLRGQLGTVPVAGLAAVAAVPVMETVASAINPPPRLVEPPPPPPEPVVVPAPVPERRSGFPWWIIPLLLLLLLGGCWLLRPKPAVAPAVVTTPVAANLVITDPADGAEVPVTGFSMSGTGPAGETYQVFRDGNDVGTFTVSDDSNWNVDIVDTAVEPGQQTYTVRTPDGNEVATLPVTAVAAEGAAPATNVAPVAGNLTITDPADGAEVPVTGFSLSGTGPAGETFQVFRDGNDVGTFTVGEGGNWNVDIVDTAVEPGQQTYTVRTPDGNEVATLPVTAVAVDGASGNATPATSATTPTVPAPVPAPTTPVAADLMITDPADGADVPVTGFSMTGTGPAGETYQVFRNGNDVGTFTVGPSGNWNVDIVDPAVEPGQQTYTVRTPDGNEVATLPVTAVAVDGASGNATPATPAVAAPTASAPATPVPAPKPAARLAITAPANGAQVPASGFSLSGTGPAGETFQMFRDGNDAGTFTVGPGGDWNVDIVAAATDVGQQTYTVRTPDGTQVATLPVTGQATTPQVDAAVTPTLPEVGINQPKSGAQVPASGFNLAGTGPAGGTFEVIEDDTGSPNDSSLGTFTVAPDGKWTFAVPGPSTGPKTYVVRTPTGAELATVPVTVAVPVTAAACTDTLSVNLGDGARVSAPFRFGGIGNAQNYTVTVKRGQRVIGTEQIKLTPDCTWSYVSRPGGRQDIESQVTYQVRPSGGTQAPARQLTLTVNGSGVNFNADGEYVGPTGQ